MRKILSPLTPLVLGLSALPFCGASETPVSQTPQKPNVLFIILDDLLPRLNCYGDTGMVTPNIDKLAREGVVFQNAYCQFAVCGPSRASFLSGLRPDSTRCYNNNSLQLRKNVGEGLVTMPQYFKNNGYYSLAVGKVYHHSASQPGEDEASWSRPSFHPGGPGYRHYFTQEAMDDIAKQNKEVKQQKRSRARGVAFEAADGVSDDLYPDGLVVAQVKSRIPEIKAAGKPFFFAVGFQKPHIPYTCPKKYWDLYPEDSIKLEAGPLPENPNKYMTEGAKEFYSYSNIPKTPFPPELQKNLIRGYKACVSFADAQVGRVIEMLQENGMLENTIIVLIGDNGYHFGDHASWGKMTNFEGGTRVPLIVYAKGMQGNGQQTRDFVELVDIAPTLTQLAGLPAYKGFEGTSFVPVLNNPVIPWKDAVYSQYERIPDKVMGYTVRTRDYRYVEWRESGPSAGNPPAVLATELYDLKKDPTEMKNVADAPEYAKARADMTAKLKAGWRSSIPTLAK